MEKSKNENEMSEDAKRFNEWLESLSEISLLDLIMNCGYLLGKKLYKKEQEHGKSEICDNVQLEQDNA